ncbi:MAG: ribonuclease P protein component [Hyphomonadaceae bacterium]|nr:ribonuclease P protein component [Hyphomonadaceae bacterium]
MITGVTARALPADRNPDPIAVERLRVRREFLYVADGIAERRKLLVVQARRRPEPREAAGAGFTTTKKVGNSVVRNRARRRLREGARALLPLLGVSGVDYVFIARQDTGSAPWTRLLDDMEIALITLRRRLAAEGSPVPGAGNPSPARG